MKETKYSKYEININNKEYSCGSREFAHLFPRDYHNEHQYFLRDFFKYKKIYLNGTQAREKSGDSPDSYHVSGNYIDDIIEGEVIYIEPNQDVIVERDYRYFDFFYAVCLKQFYERKDKVEINNFIGYQLETNFNNDIISYIKFLIKTLEKYSTSVFFNNNENEIEYLLDEIEILKEKWETKMVGSTLTIEPITNSQNQSNIKPKQSNDIQTKALGSINEYFYPDYFEYFLNKIEYRFSIQEGKRKVFLIIETSGKRNWVRNFKYLSIMIRMLIEYGYINKKYHAGSGFKTLKRAFGEYYSVNLNEHAKPSDYKKINLNIYKVELDFIIT